MHFRFHIFIVNNLERCAILYQHKDYKGLLQYVGVGRINQLAHNDVVSSVQTTPGCSLFGYEDFNNVGLMFIAIQNLPWLESHNDKMSSTKCYCGRYAH